MTFLEGADLGDLAPVNPRCRSGSVASSPRRHRVHGTAPLAALPLQSGVRDRDRLQQLLGIQGLGVVENLLPRPLLHHPAVVHHDNVVTEMSNRCQVVRDEEHGEMQLLLQVAEHVEDLRLNGHVQG